MPCFHIFLVFGMLQHLYGRCKMDLFWLVRGANRKVLKEKHQNLRNSKNMNKNGFLIKDQTYFSFFYTPFHSPPPTTTTIMIRKRRRKERITEDYYNKLSSRTTIITFLPYLMLHSVLSFTFNVILT